MAKILKFYFAPNWDAREHAIFTWAPDDWDDMDGPTRRDFERTEVLNWLQNESESGIVAFDTLEQLVEHQRKQWGGYVPDGVEEIEDWYGVIPS